MRTQRMTPTGLENTSFSSSNTNNSDSPGARAGAVDGGTGPDGGTVSSDLAELMELWSDLPQETRAPILAIARGGWPTPR